MNNKSIQILRGSESYDPSKSDEVLLDGQPFYSKKTGDLYIGDGSTKLSLLTDNKKQFINNSKINIDLGNAYTSIYVSSPTTADIDNKVRLNVPSIGKDKFKLLVNNILKGYDGKRGNPFIYNDYSLINIFWQDHISTEFPVRILRLKEFNVFDNEDYPDRFYNLYIEGRYEIGYVTCRYCCDKDFNHISIVESFYNFLAADAASLITHTNNVGLELKNILHLEANSLIQEINTTANNIMKMIPEYKLYKHNAETNPVVFNGIRFYKLDFNDVKDIYYNFLHGVKSVILKNYIQYDSKEIDFVDEDDNSLFNSTGVIATITSAYRYLSADGTYDNNIIVSVLVDIPDYISHTIKTYSVDYSGTNAGTCSVTINDIFKVSNNNKPSIEQVNVNSLIVNNSLKLNNPLELNVLCTFNSGFSVNTIAQFNELAKFQNAHFEKDVEIMDSLYIKSSYNSPSNIYLGGDAKIQFGVAREDTFINKDGINIYDRYIRFPEREYLHNTTNEQYILITKDKEDLKSSLNNSLETAIDNHNKSPLHTQILDYNHSSSNNYKLAYEFSINDVSESSLKANQTYLIRFYY